MSAAEQAPLSPDPIVIQSFMDEWFHYCVRGEVQIGWFPGWGDGLTQFRTFELGSDEIGDAIAEINAVPGQSVYFRPATVKEGLGATAAGDEHVMEAPGCWGDLDDAGGAERASKVETLIRPNLWVETARTPHWRAQGFWRLEQPCSPDIVSGLNRRIIALYRSDPHVYNPSRLMRVPGTINWSRKAGRVSEMTRLVVPEGRPRSYSLEFLLRSLPHEQAEPGPQPEPPPSGFQRAPGLTTVSSLLDTAAQEGKWHDAVVRLVAHWVGRGWSNREILVAAEHLTTPGFRLEQTRRDLWKMAEGARRKWGVGDQDHAVGDGPAQPFEGGVIDPWDELRPLAFPSNVLPPALEAFAYSRAKAIGCDPAAVAMSCLSALSAAMDGQSRLRLKVHDGWRVPPALWVALIGPSSARKSPATRAAWAPLERHQSRLLALHAAEVGEWKKLEKEDRGDPPRSPTRYVTHDGTMEAIQGILGNQTRGVGILRDELAGFISALDKYSNGRGGGADRAFYLQAFDGGPFVVDRVARGTVAIENLLVTICGGIQPDRLMSFGDLTDDGLWQRFIPVIMGPPNLGEDIAGGDAEADYEAMLERVLRLPTLLATLSSGAQAERQHFEKQVFALETGDVLGAAFSSFLGKLHGLWGRIALVLHAADGTGFPETVGEATARRASRMILEYIVPSAARVYLAMGAGAGGSHREAVRDVAGFILSKKLPRVLASGLARDVRACRSLPLHEIQKIVSPLVAGGWLAPEKDHGGNSSWLVNPMVHERFAERALSEGQRRSRIRNVILDQVVGEEP